MKRTIITVLLALAISAVPGSKAKAVEPATVMFIVGLVIDGISIWASSQSGGYNLHNTSGALSSQLIDEVGDATYYTVVTDADGDSLRLAEVRVKLVLSDGSTMTETKSFYNDKHLEFKFDIEALKAGNDSVYAVVELWVYDITAMKMLKEDWTTTATEYFSIDHAYALRADVSPGTHYVRHYELFSSKLQVKIKTPKNGSASGTNVKNSFSNYTLQGQGSGESAWTTMNTCDTNHANMPCGIVPGEMGPVVALIVGENADVATNRDYDFDRTPPHLLPKTFDVSPLKATFIIPKTNFILPRDTNYKCTLSLDPVQMTCTGWKIWQGNVDTDVDIVINGDWAGWDDTVNINISFLDDTNQYTIFDQFEGLTVAEGTWNFGSPMITLTPDTPAGAPVRKYFIISDSPEKLILYGGREQELSTLQNLAAGMDVPPLAIEGEIIGLDPALAPHTFVAAYSTAGFGDPSEAYANAPVAVAKVDPTGHYLLPHLNEGDYVVAAYTLDVPAPSIPLPQDYAGRYNMRTFTAGIFETPTIVNIPPGGMGSCYFELLPEYEVLPAVSFGVSTHGGEAEIVSIELTGDNHVILHCSGPWAQVQMRAGGSDWRKMIGDVDGDPPSWTWTSFEAMSENVAWFRLKN